MNWRSIFHRHGVAMTRIRPLLELFHPERLESLRPDPIPVVNNFYMRLFAIAHALRPDDGGVNANLERLAALGFASAPETPEKHDA